MGDSLAKVSETHVVATLLSDGTTEQNVAILPLNGGRKDALIMGTWGTGLYSDDLAADLRTDSRDCIGEGLSAAAAVDRLMAEYASSIDDPDEGTVFWLALADVGWRLGHLDERVRQKALKIISDGHDVTRWVSASDRRKRERILAKLRDQLLS